MSGADLFDLYRRLLTLVVTVYLVFRLSNAYINLQTSAAKAGRTQGLLWRYLAVQLLRTRLRRFVPELLQILILAGLLGYLLWRHF